MCPLHVSRRSKGGEGEVIGTWYLVKFLPLAQGIDIPLAGTINSDTMHVLLTCRGSHLSWSSTSTSTPALRSARSASRCPLPAGRDGTRVGVLTGRTQRRGQREYTYVLRARIRSIYTSMVLVSRKHLILSTIGSSHIFF